MVLLWLVVDVEVALPFQLGAVGEVIQSVTHLVCCISAFSCSCMWWKLRKWWARKYLNLAVGVRSRPEMRSATVSMDFKQGESAREGHTVPLWGFGLNVRVGQTNNRLAGTEVSPEKKQQ